MLTFDATEQINEVSRTTTTTRTRTTTQVITRCFGRWPQTKKWHSNLITIRVVMVQWLFSNFENFLFQIEKLLS